MTTDSNRNRHFFFYIAAGALLAGSLSWHIIQTGEVQKRNEQIKNLEQANNHLHGKLFGALQSGSSLRKEIEDLQSRLEKTGTSLRKLQEMAWQEKFEKLQSDHSDYRLFTRQSLAAANAEEARLQRALAFQQSRNLELAGKLEEERTQYEKSISAIDKLAAEKEQMELLVDELEKQLQILVKNAEQKQVAGIEDAHENKISQYRRTRLQSLQNAMTTQNSETRKSILLDVIPTIPAGVSTNELLTLVQNMNSSDILEVIKYLDQYIKRPIDNTSISLLAGTMNEADAVSASLILTGH